MTEEAAEMKSLRDWGLPSTILEGATFGRITSMARTPRIMQFGTKYGF
jgi:hypothetical protein